jgi:D-beta-D-heptose 7-phosphate kinase / D-beta-D-heptose 1-phosphate adenosyltransferase
MENLDKIVDLIELQWKDQHLLVVGDVMLDQYIWGEVKRISPEAPVPVVRAVHHGAQPGGAANVAMNVAGLGARVTVAGFVGEDENGRRLGALLEGAGVKTKLADVSAMPTVSKLRILSGSQQMLRVDSESRETLPKQAYDDLLERVKRTLPGISAVILSDYAKGVLSERVCQEVIAAARELEIPVLVDPKSLDFGRYRGATTICPNLHELAAVVRGAAAGESLDALLTAGEQLVASAKLEYLVVTLSEKGIALVREGSRVIAPATAREVFDVSGAGDTVIAVLGLCVGAGLPIENGIQLANVAAGVVVGKSGTVPIHKFELLAALSGAIAVQAEEKVLEADRLLGRVAAWRSAGQKVVFTNGCFDLLHVGHIMLLEKARHEGDRLIVAINSDSSVRALKGTARPIVGERERAQVLAALAAVDAVVIFSEETPLQLIEMLRPDVIVKGGDYTEESVVGAVQVRAWGGRVKIVPIVEGFSTTKLIEKSMTPV